MKGCFKFVAIGFLLLVGIAIIGSIFGLGSQERIAQQRARKVAAAAAVTPHPTPIPTLSVEQIKVKAERVTYEQLMRTPEQFDGKPIRFRGEVLQTGSEDPWFAAPYGWLRIQIESEDFSSDAVPSRVGTCFVYWNHDNRILTGDTIEVFGLGDGRMTYKTVLGSEMTIPQIDARAVTVISE